MLKHLVLRTAIKPVVIRVYVDGRFDILHTESPNSKFATEFIREIIRKGGAAKKMKPGDYRFTYNKMDRGDAIFDVEPI